MELPALGVREAFPTKASGCSKLRSDAVVERTALFLLPPLRARTTSQLSAPAWTAWAATWAAWALSPGCGIGIDIVRFRRWTLPRPRCETLRNVPRGPGDASISAVGRVGISPRTGFCAQG